MEIRNLLYGLYVNGLNDYIFNTIFSILEYYVVLYCCKDKMNDYNSNIQIINNLYLNNYCGFFR